MGPHLHELAQCRHMRTVLFSPGSELLGFLYHQHLKRAGQSNPLPTMSSLSEAQLHQDLLLQSQQVCRYPKLLVPCFPRLSRELGALLGYDFHLNPSAGFPHATILSRTKIQASLWRQEGRPPAPAAGSSPGPPAIQRCSSWMWHSTSFLLALVPDAVNRWGGQASQGLTDAPSLP